jgi:V/A-type H+-transporting ATPase subunit E
MADATKTSSGVQELIARIRDEGTKAGEDQAEQLVADARREAAQIVAQARAEAEALRDQAHAEIKAEEEAATASLRNAARDSVLELQATVRARFESFVHRLVTKEMRNENFIRSLVLVLAGHVTDDFVKDRHARIFVDENLLGDYEKAVGEPMRSIVLQITSEMLREGLELVPATGVHGGAKVQLVGENLEIDLTDDAIAELLLQYVLPRYRRIIEGED